MPCMQLILRRSTFIGVPFGKIKDQKGSIYSEGGDIFQKVVPTESHDS